MQGADIGPQLQDKPDCSEKNQLQPITPTARKYSLYR